MSRKYKIGTTIGAFQLTEYIGTNPSNGNHIYLAKCRQCGNTEKVDSYTIQLGQMNACSTCEPETRREISAKEQLLADRVAEAAAQQAKVAEQARLDAIRKKAEYEARLTLEFGSSYVQEMNARNARRAQR